MSIKTAMMVLGSKPKKANSVNPGDKKRISLLNCDFKLCESVEATGVKEILPFSKQVFQKLPVASLILT